MRLSTIITISAASLLVTACSKSKSTSTTDPKQAVENSVADEAAVERDSLIALFNYVNEDIQQIKNMESIISMPSNFNGDNGSSTIDLRDDLLAIQRTLEMRRQKLEELEKKLSFADGQNADLLKMVENMKIQLDENKRTISTLNQRLSEANKTINSLNTAVDSLNNSVAAVTAEKDEADQMNQALTEEVNKCFYAIGSKKELKEHKIIETGFLKKTKIMQGDFEASYFTQADRRTLTVIPLYSKKAKVITNQPADSYTITTDGSGLKALSIMSPSKFWATSNYLVIQTD